MYEWQYSGIIEVSIAGACFYYYEGFYINWTDATSAPDVMQTLKRLDVKKMLHSVVITILKGCP